MTDVFVQRGIFIKHHVAGQGTDGEGVEGGADACVPFISFRGREGGVRLREKGPASIVANNLRQ